MSKRAIKVVFPAEAIVGKIANISRSSSRRYGSVPAFVGYQRSYGPQNMFQVKVRNSMSLTSAQQEQRTKFTVANNTARAWVVDPTKSTRIIAAYRKQVNDINGYATINGFVAAKVLKNMEGTTAPEFDKVFPAA